MGYHSHLEVQDSKRAPQRVKERAALDEEREHQHQRYMAPLYVSSQQQHKEDTHAKARNKDEIVMINAMTLMYD
jgi:hypothetical protein